MQVAQLSNAQAVELGGQALDSHFLLDHLKTDHRLEHSQAGKRHGQSQNRNGHNAAAAQIRKRQTDDAKRNAQNLSPDNEDADQKREILKDASGVHHPHRQIGRHHRAPDKARDTREKGSRQHGKQTPQALAPIVNDRANTAHIDDDRQNKINHHKAHGLVLA